MDKAEYEHALRLAKEIQWAQEAGQIARALLAANKIVEVARLGHSRVQTQGENHLKCPVCIALRDLDQGKA